MRKTGKVSADQERHLKGFRGLNRGQECDGPEPRAVIIIRPSVMTSAFFPKKRDLNDESETS